MEKVGQGGIRQAGERILFGLLVGLCLLACGLFYWIVIVFVNALTLWWLKAVSVLAVTVIPLAGILGAFAGFTLGKRDANLTLGGFWSAVNTVIPQMNTHAQEMSDIRVTSARQMYRENPHALDLDASVVMPALITERVQETREEEV